MIGIAGIAGTPRLGFANFPGTFASGFNQAGSSTVRPDLASGNRWLAHPESRIHRPSSGFSTTSDTLETSERHCAERSATRDSRVIATCAGLPDIGTPKVRNCRRIPDRSTSLRSRHPYRRNSTGRWLRLLACRDQRAARQEHSERWEARQLATGMESGRRLSNTASASGLEAAARWGSRLNRRFGTAVPDHSGFGFILHTSTNRKLLTWSGETLIRTDG